MTNEISSLSLREKKLQYNYSMKIIKFVQKYFVIIRTNAYRKKEEEEEEHLIIIIIKREFIEKCN